MQYQTRQERHIGLFSEFKLFISIAYKRVCFSRFYDFVGLMTLMLLQWHRGARKVRIEAYSLEVNICSSLSLLCLLQASARSHAIYFL